MIILEDFFGQFRFIRFLLRKRGWLYTTKRGWITYKTYCYLKYTGFDPGLKKTEFMSTDKISDFIYTILESKDLTNIEKEDKVKELSDEISKALFYVGAINPNT